MSRTPTMSQLLKRAGLAKRPRPGRSAGRDETVPGSQRETRRSRPVADDSREHLPGGNGEEDRGEKSNGEEREEEEQEDGDGAGKGHRGDGVGKGKAEGVAVDDQIAALERELEGGDGASSSDSGSDDDGSDDQDSTIVADTPDRNDAAAKHKRPRTAKLVSPLEAEKIEPLAAHLLPRPGCGIQKAPKKKKRDRPKAEGALPGEVSAASGSFKGLDSAVKELMANYEARSSERVPFYCRVCKFQGDSLDALEQHKREPLHLEATKKERKISTCSLCKKQFTSPPQLKEHLAGKAHLERLQSVMSRQGKWVPGDRGRGGGGGGGRGRGRGGRGAEAGRSNGFAGRDENGLDYSPGRGGGRDSGWGIGRGRGGGSRGGREGRGRGGRGRGPGRGYDAGR